MPDENDFEGSAVNFDAFPLTDIDRQILSMRDEDYHLTQWDELTEIISSNRLEQLKRKPSDLRRYLAWSADTKAKYGSITNFVVQERLHWQPLPSDNRDAPPTFLFQDSVPFTNSNDFNILLNDWPYGLAEDITHVCVWSKTPIATDPTTGDVTSESRRAIEGFVSSTFATPLDAVFGPGRGKENVLWFKNWVALQSVRGVDHVHVLLRCAPKHLIDGWTARKP